MASPQHFEKKNRYNSSNDLIQLQVLFFLLCLSGITVKVQQSKKAFFSEMKRNRRAYLVSNELENGKTNDYERIIIHSLSQRLALLGNLKFQ
jgi:hypothetical protein